MKQKSEHQRRAKNGHFREHCKNARSRGGNVTELRDGSNGKLDCYATGGWADEGGAINLPFKWCIPIVYVQRTIHLKSLEVCCSLRVLMINTRFRLIATFIAFRGPFEFQRHATNSKGSVFSYSMVISLFYVSLLCFLQIKSCRNVLTK